MSKLLLPYAYDCDGNLVHVDNAQKGEKYICPNCGVELLLKKSQIPEGQKYHRRDHFAHKSNSDNHCSESFLHKLFKDKCVDLIKDKIAKGDQLRFEWFCDQCNEKHEGNLLKKATDVVSEYDLGICRPDIALLDKSGKVIIVIEVEVTHKPTPETKQYYKDNNIACLLINVTDFDDCENIGHKLSNPDEVYIYKCPNPKCEKCGHRMNRVKMVIVTTNCWKCGHSMKVAMLVYEKWIQIGKSIVRYTNYLKSSDFNEREINIARTLGARIEKRHRNTIKSSYMANTCRNCNAFVGDFHMHKYYHLPYTSEKDLGYRCFNCHKMKIR